MTQKRMKPLRKMTDPQLRERLVEINTEAAKFDAARNVGTFDLAGGGGGMANLPTGKNHGVRWGIYKGLRRERARIKGILWERNKDKRPML